MSLLFNILEGDAYSVLDSLEPASIDCIFTSPDPPQSGSDLMKLELIFGKVKRIMKPTGCIWLHMGDFHNEEGTLEQMPQRFSQHMTDKLGWLKRSEIIWYRPVRPREAIRTRQDPNRFLISHDYILWFTQSRFGYHFCSNSLFSLSSVAVVPYEMPRPGVFESGFPESIIASCLLISCPTGGTVLDPFCGTATTGLVALKSGRKFIGIEKDETKVPKIEERLSKLEICQ